MKKVHYVGLAGLHGAWPSFCSVYDSIADAAQGLGDIHELSKKRIAELRRDQYLELDLHLDGNEYCEITACDCDDPFIHSDI